MKTTTRTTTSIGESTTLTNVVNHGFEDMKSLNTLKLPTQKELIIKEMMHYKHVN